MRSVDRRLVLQAACAVLAGAAWPARAQQQGNATDPESIARLLGEIAALEAREYSEVGIPMLVVGENLAGGRSGPPEGFEPTDINEELARRYRELAALLPALDRPVGDYDPALLVELLAARDLARGGA